jgi:hypothetical protein
MEGGDSASKTDQNEHPGSDSQESETLDLLHQWLSCDDDAGRELWFGSVGLWFEYQKKAMKRGWDFVSAKLSWVYFAEARDSMVGWADETLLAIWGTLKGKVEDDKAKVDEPGIEPAPAGSKQFNSLGKFHAYLNTSLNRIVSIICEQLGLGEPVVGGLEGTGEERGERRSVEQTVSDPGPGPDQTVIENEKRQKRDALSRQLLEEFKEFLGSRPSLLNQLEMVIACFERLHPDDPPVARLEVIKFLEIGHEHYPEVRDCCVNLGGQNPNAYSANNRRLRAEWLEFKESDGKNLWDEFRETR